MDIVPEPGNEIVQQIGVAQSSCSCGDCLELTEIGRNGGLLGKLVKLSLMVNKCGGAKSELQLLDKRIPSGQLRCCMQPVEPLESDSRHVECCYGKFLVMRSVVIGKEMLDLEQLPMDILT